MNSRQCNSRTRSAKVALLMQSRVIGRKSAFHMLAPLPFLVTLGILAPSLGEHASAETSGPEEYQARPSSPPPVLAPPAPPISIPPAPGAELTAPLVPIAPATSPVPMPAGQWVYTHEYGWLWIPYDQKYVHVTEVAKRFGCSAVAYEYAYYPVSGWRWVLAPWILRFGVVPYWGGLGPERFAWYTHPWFRTAIVEGAPYDASTNRVRTQRP